MEQVEGAGAGGGRAQPDGAPSGGPPPAARREHSHDPVHDMADHVLTKLGLQVTMDGGAPTFALPLHPVLLGAGGHVDFGVLGVYLDMAASQVLAGGQDRPWVHADITMHRLAAPRGQVLVPTTTAVRMGGRSGVVVIEVHDDAGTHVARSVQEIVFTGAARPPGTAGDRKPFFELFHGGCTLAAPLPEELGIVAGDGEGDGRPWSIPLSDGSRNGFGGLHGGVTVALVEAAAVGALGDEPAAAGWAMSASVRYLAPSLVGPFLATPRIVARRGDVALVSVEVRDPGMDDRLTVLADVHVSLAESPGA
jgi:acyl-coenzyme A thioesterase PaaI-like protein